jgi:HEAT repeat protein
LKTKGKRITWNSLMIKSTQIISMEVGMGSQVDDLVAMRDSEALYQIMAEEEDWMIQLDAAEGLIKLGDHRGLDFLLSAQDNDEREIRDSPMVANRRQEMKSEYEREFKKKVENAKTRLQKGRRIFISGRGYFEQGISILGTG